MRKPLLLWSPSRFFGHALAGTIHSRLYPKRSYWNDGKAEFDIYDAQILRYGQPRQTEVLHILVREPFDLQAIG